MVMDCCLFCSAGFGGEGAFSMCGGDGKVWIVERQAREKRMRWRTLRFRVNLLLLSPSFFLACARTNVQARRLTQHHKQQRKSQPATSSNIQTRHAHPRHFLPIHQRHAIHIASIANRDQILEIRLSQHQRWNRTC